MTALMTGIRYAPSPTGRFHIGNLRTAWISQQWSIARSEPLIFRFEDIDRPRVRPDAQALQLADLATLGIIPDSIVVQTSFHLRHLDLLRRALHEGYVYACDCSRADVQAALTASASAPHGASPIYSGHCRDLDPARKLAARDSIAWRFRMPDDSGRDDFIAARSSDIALTGFVPAYNWACAIDDHDGGYSLLVRAWDLSSARAAQNAVHAWLSKTSAPAVFHTSLITQNDGHRLEKRTPGVTLPDLLASGWNAKRLLACFGASFTLALGDGEPARTLSLNELGL